MHRCVLVMIVPAIVLLVTAPGAVSRNETDMKLETCQKRCAGFDGQSRATCLRTCTRTMHREAPTGTMPVKEHIRECEEACRELNGLDHLRCRRRCLDGAVPPRSDGAVEPQDPCVSRCAAMPQSLRQKCRDKCGGS